MELLGVLIIIVNDFYGSELGNPQYSDHFCPINIYDMDEIRLTKEDFLSGLTKLEGVIKVADGIASCYKGHGVLDKAGIIIREELRRAAHLLLLSMDKTKNPDKEVFDKLKGIMIYGDND